MQKIHIAFCLFLAAYSTLSYAGPKHNKAWNNFREKSALRLLVFNQAIGMPPNVINGRLHPGIDIGIQAPYKLVSKKCFFDYNASLGYFSQQQLQRVGYLKIGSGYRCGVLKGFSLRPSLQLSVFHVTQANREFIYKGNGIYEEYKGKRIQTKPGVGVAILSPSIKFNRVHLNVEAGYEFGLQVPFSALSKALPLNQLHIGILLKAN